MVFRESPQRLTRGLADPDGIRYLVRVLYGLQSWLIRRDRTESRRPVDLVSQLSRFTRRRQRSFPRVNLELLSDQRFFYWQSGDLSTECRNYREQVWPMTLTSPTLRSGKDVHKGIDPFPPSPDRPSGSLRSYVGHSYITLLHAFRHHPVIRWCLWCLTSSLDQGPRHPGPSYGI